MTLVKEPAPVDAADTVSEIEMEIRDWVQIFWEDNPDMISKPFFHTEVAALMTEEIAQWWVEADIWPCHEDEDELWDVEDLYELVLQVVIEHSPTRYRPTEGRGQRGGGRGTPGDADKNEDEETEKWKEKVRTIMEKDAGNPKQGSAEWMRQRYNLITASDVSKALTTEAQLRSLIRSKSGPLNLYGASNAGDEGGSGAGVGTGDAGDDDTHSGVVNTNGPSAMAWGHMFEPVAVKIYEYLTGERVLHAGCLLHPHVPFLGASPDGIVSPFPEDGGVCMRPHLLEIKCPISREIDGVPSEAYWVQQQIQMEVCDIDCCDFFECTFKLVSFEELQQMVFPAVSSVSNGSGTNAGKMDVKDSEKSEQIPGTRGTTEIQGDADPEVKVFDLFLKGCSRPPVSSSSPASPGIADPISREKPLFFGAISEYSLHKIGQYPLTKRIYSKPFATHTVESSFLEIIDPLSGNFPTTDEMEVDICDGDGVENSVDESTVKSRDMVLECSHAVGSGKCKPIWIDSPEALQKYWNRSMPRVHPECVSNGVKNQFIKTVTKYWVLEHMSLVEVERNRDWFAAVLPRLRSAWSDIVIARMGNY